MSTAKTHSNHESSEVRDLRAIVAGLRSAKKDDEAFETSFQAVQLLSNEIRRLQLKLLALRKKAVGKTSERTNAEQLSLLLEEFAALTADIIPADGGEYDAEQEARADATLTAEIEEAEEAAAEIVTDDAPTGGRTRGLNLDDLEVVDEFSTLSDDDLRDEQTGRVATLIDYDVVTTLEFHPGRFFVVRTKVARYGFGGDGAKGVLSAPAPSKVIPRSPAGASLLADVLVGKLVDHLPLFRQHLRYARAGMLIPHSTLADWFGRAAEQLRPLADLLFERMRKAGVVRIDASGIKVQDPRSAENIIRGTMWCMVGDDKDVVFRFAPDGTGEQGPWTYLAGREGYIQSDAANIFDRLFNGKVANAVAVGCNTHSRRNFTALVDSDSRAAYPLQLYRRLYRLETLAGVQKLAGDDLRDFRQDRSIPVLNKLYRWLAANAKADPPDMPFAQAIAYAINHKDALCRYVEDGRLDIDNNLNEQQIRFLALGRKNYLFAGSARAAERLAIGYTITRSCAMHGVPPWEYITSVLTKLAGGWPEDRLHELLPDAWLLANPIEPADPPLG